MRVSELVESRHVVKSDRRLTFEELSELAENARVNGKCDEQEVLHVDIWCEKAFSKGKPDRDAIAR